MPNHPSSLEDQLRHSLRRKEPPGGFADGVLRRVAQEKPTPLTGPRSHPFARLRTLNGGLAAMLLLMLLIPLGNTLYQRQRQARAERAAQQFALAMRLTHAAMLDVGQQILDHHRRHSGN